MFLLYNYVIMWKSLAILGVVLFTGSVSGQPNQAATGNQQKPQPKAQAASIASSKQSADTHTSTTNDDPPEWHAAIKRPEWWLVVAAFLTIFYLAKQAKETRKAAEATKDIAVAGKDTAKRQLRAYIVPERGSIYNVADPLAEETLEGMDAGEARVVNPSIGPIATVFIKNTGRTPSFDVKHTCTVFHREFPLAAPLLDMQFPKQSAMILGPQVIATLTVPLPERLNEFSIQSLRHNASVIYVQGVISYTDIFGDCHTTHYRFMHNLRGAKIGRSTDLTFCEEGNYGD